MDEILQANVFFAIASVATVCFCIFVCLILYQILKITKSLRSIIERIEAGSEVVANDIAHVRSLVAEGSTLNKVFQFIIGKTRPKTKTRRSRKED